MSENSSSIEQNSPFPDNYIYHEPWLISNDAWVQSLETIPNFEGDALNSAFLLRCFSSGMKKNQDLLFEPKNIKSPPLAISFGPNSEKGTVSLIATTDGSHAVMISKNYLAYLAQHNPLMAYEFPRADQTIYFRGYPSELAFFLGLEESNHEYYLSQNPEYKGQYVDALSMPKAQYEAIDVEYVALLQKLEVAKKNHFSSYAIEFLEESIRAANKFR